MKKVPVSVLIPTMNRPDTLKATLESYMSAEFVPSQIVVVDQSENKVIANNVKNIVLHYIGFIDIQYIYQQKQSLTKARNNALKYSKYEIIICSDDDVELYKDTLKNIYDIMLREEVSLIAGINDNALKSKTNIGYFFGTKSFKKRKIGHVTLSMLGRYPDNIIGEVETEWAMGYFFVVRKSLLKKWDISWDENLISYAYAEDLDFSYRYYKKSIQYNFKCILSDKVHVKHLASSEYRVPKMKSTIMYVLNRYYLSYKHNMGFKSRIAIKWSNFWRCVERTLKKQAPKDFRYALKLYRKNKKYISKGILNPDLYN